MNPINPVPNRNPAPATPGPVRARRVLLAMLWSGSAVLVVSLALRAAAPPEPAALAAPAPDITKAELGRLLFWDPILSGSQDVACATCHHPQFGYTDGRALPLGTGSQGLGPHRVSTAGSNMPAVRRNSPTILNVAYNGLGAGGGRGGRGGPGGRGGNNNLRPLPALTNVDQTRAPMFWDSRVRSLELQALEPIKAREEMRGDGVASDRAVEVAVARLGEIPEYVALFRQVFGTDSRPDAGQLSTALAAFERTLVAGHSPYDLYLAGDTSALTPAQARGLDAFRRVGCITCHGGPMLSDFRLHALGVKENPALAAPDPGDGSYRFRTPTLRNVALTAPYMHNGTMTTLESVVAFYNRGRSENPAVADGAGRGGRGGRGAGGPPPPPPPPPPAPGAPVVDRDFRGVQNMNSAVQNDIVAFLHSLTDSNFDRIIPTRVPSGLPPGGAESKTDR